MKKFKFRLGTLLNIKKAEMKNLEFQLAAIMKNIEEHKRQISYDQGQIRYTLDKANTELAQGQFAAMAQYTPELVQAKRFNIGLHESEIEIKQFSVHEIQRKIAAKENEIKVLEKLREKDLIKYKKMVVKKENEKIEELNKIRSFYFKGEEL
ncbi:MAG: hypothetical protein H6621_12715 [Halobacteriovoraceae bacterium]|nr:hypothetical protein [Halobacteriovoraceae bacterium]MCB9095923.1 hypothetical protein [Halobacteriovoraceae bacterium]